MRLWFLVAFMMPLPGLHLAVQSGHPDGEESVPIYRWLNCPILVVVINSKLSWLKVDGTTAKRFQKGGLIYYIISYQIIKGGTGGARLTNTLELCSVLSGTNLLHNGTWFWVCSGCDQTTSDNMRQSDKRCCIAMPLYWDHGNLRVPPPMPPPQKIGPY